MKHEQQMQLDVTQKYNRFKKSSSLSAYYLNQARVKKISSIYRSLTTDKIRVYSSSKSQRRDSVCTPEKKCMQNSPFTQASMNSFLESQGKGKQKLTIKRGSENHPPITTTQTDQHVHLVVKIKSLTSKL